MEMSFRPSHAVRKLLLLKRYVVKKKKRRENRQEVHKLRCTLSDRLCANLRVFFIFFVLKKKFHFRRLQGTALTSFVHIYELCYIVMYVVETVAW